MKTLIIYASKTGTTEKCAKEIKKQLEDAKIVNITNLNEDIATYDFIIIGTPIRMSMIDKKIKKFLIRNREILKLKKVAYFICCGFHESWEKYYKENIPKELLDSAIAYDTFGGEMNLQKQKGLDKWITKIVNKNIDKTKEIKILKENIERFIKAVRLEEFTTCERKMKIKVVKNIAIVNSNEIVIKDVGSAIDFMMTVKYETNCNKIALNKEAITEDFFILSRKLAGEILQKFINYQIKFAIYGDFSKYTSKPLKDFIYESNHGKDIFFVENEEETIKILSKL